MLNFKDYLTIKDAAEFIGVCPNTLRNWERKRLIPTYASPFSRNRLYKKEDLENFLNNIKEKHVADEEDFIKAKADFSELFHRDDGHFIVIDTLESKNETR